MRPFVHSTGQLIWTDVGLSTAGQEGTATQICVTVHSREHHERRAGDCGWPDWAIVAAVRETMRKNKNTNSLHPMASLTSPNSQTRGTMIKQLTISHN